MQKAELMIDYCRDLDLLSTIVILCLIGSSELFVADKNGFPLKMILAAAEDIDIVILLVILIGLLMPTNESLVLIPKSMFFVLSKMLIFCLYFLYFLLCERFF